MLHENVLLVLSLLFAVALLHMASTKIRISFPILLVLAGLALSLVPGLPEVRLDPDLVFLIFLPPLLYAAALSTAFADFRDNLRPIGLLSVGLVLATAAVVALATHLVLPELPLAAAFALGAIVGPILGGFVVTDYAWEWIFLINVPVGIGAFIAGFIILPESTDPHATRRIDWGGVLISGLGIFALVYAMIEGNAKGWTSPLILGLVAVGIVLLIFFVFWETRQADPMMKL